MASALASTENLVKEIKGPRLTTPFVEISYQSLLWNRTQNDIKANLLGNTSMNIVIEEIMDER